MLAGLTVKSIAKIQLSEKSALGIVKFGDNPTYIEVEKNHVDNLIDDIFGQVPGIDLNANAFANNDMGYLDDENFDAFEQQMMEMGCTMQDFDGFGDVPADTTVTTAAEEKTQTVEKSTEPQSEFDDETNSALERLGIDVQTISDFSAFK